MLLEILRITNIPYGGISINRETGDGYNSFPLTVGELLTVPDVVTIRVAERPPSGESTGSGSGSRTTTQSTNVTGTASSATMSDGTDSAVSSTGFRDMVRRATADFHQALELARKELERAQAETAAAREAERRERELREAAEARERELREAAAVRERELREAAARDGERLAVAREEVAALRARVEAEGTVSLRAAAAAAELARQEATPVDVLAMRAEINRLNAEAAALKAALATKTTGSRCVLM